MHEIDMSNGRANMAYVGQKPWHGLGHELSKNAPIETWEVEAGMNWKIKSNSVLFALEGENENDMTLTQFDGRNVLYRSDNGMPLSIVSSNYNIVQPKEVLEFFRDLVSDAGMYLETAGCLFRGRRFWAMANTGRAGDVLGKDRVKGNLLLTTSCDGTLATNAMFVATRVVCNNTLRLALDEDTQRIRVTHGRVFDPLEIKEQLGLIDYAWGNFFQTITDLSKVKVDDAKARAFYFNLIKTPNIPDTEQGWIVDRNVDILMNLFKNGMGADMSYGTAWGVINAVTENSAYGGRASADSKIWNNFYGKSAKASDDAFVKAQEVFLLAA
jgi:phage/plasmid-like protein (TIGR03299 family)